MTELLKQAFEGVKKNPAMTVLLAVNIMIMALAYWSLDTVGSRHDKQFMALMQMCFSQVHP